MSLLLTLSWAECLNNTDKFVPFPSNSLVKCVTMLKLFTLVISISNYFNLQKFIDDVAIPKMTSKYTTYLLFLQNPMVFLCLNAETNFKFSTHGTY